MTSSSINSTNPTEFYVECEVVPIESAAGYIVQQTIGSEICDSYDACYNKYSKSPFSATDSMTKGDSTNASSCDSIASLALGTSNRLKSSATGSPQDFLDEDIAPTLYDPYDSDSEAEREESTKLSVSPIHKAATSRVNDKSSSVDDGRIAHICHHRGERIQQATSLSIQSTSGQSNAVARRDPSTPSGDTSDVDCVASSLETEDEWSLTERRCEEDTMGTESSTLHGSNIMRQSSGMEGIAAYIVDDNRPTPLTSPTETSKSTTTISRNKTTRTRKQPAPWYCISRPIHEQTKDIKISSINRSSSIHFSRIIQKCRSIVEFCMLRTEHEEVTEQNVESLNYNHAWGDSLPTNAKGNTIRVVYQNVNRSISASDNPHTTNLLDNLFNMEADIFMASETNVNWKTASNRNSFRQKVSRVWPSNKIAFSSSDIGLQFEMHEFLPGGTCTMATDHLSMRVVKIGEDMSGLGRWSFITLEGQGGRKVTFITAYRICKGAMRGTSTSCIQQRRVINEQEMKQGVPTSCPDTKFLREKLVDDLLLFIKSLQDEGHAIVLGLDANETPQEAIKDGKPVPGSVAWLLESAGLREVFDSRHNDVPESTTTTSGRFIDRVAVSGIGVQRATLLRAHEPAHSDHLGIAVDLDLKYLFDNACSSLVQQQPRKLTSGNKTAVQKYLTFVQKQFSEHRIWERCQRLREACESDSFTDMHRQQLFTLDRQVTEILLGAENQCSNKRVFRNLWSPALRKAGKEIIYWKRRLSTNGNLDEGTHDLGIELDLPKTFQQPMTVQLCQFYLGIAWQTYRGIQRQSRMYREKFLKERAREQAAKGNGDVANAIKQIRRREKLKHDYASIRRGYGISKHGLATLDVPDPETGGRRIVTQSDEIHDYLLQRNAKHFSQATFTPFGDAGPGFSFIDPENPESDRHIDEMLKGVFTPWPSASPAVCEILKELKCVVTAEMSVKLNLGDFKQLFKSIPENTGSSVSGLHYGHYRVLSKCEDESFIQVLFDIVDIAFKTHSPLPRWQHATQLMLEKGKGPAIENLRIIQILEADMNWLLRFLWGRQLERHAVDAGAYNEAQFASPGKLCQSGIVNKVLFFDLLRQTRQYGALTDNDATAAFDRVLPALCVVTCRQLGMSTSAQRFFFRLLRQMVYTTTTAHGRSKSMYSASADPNVPGQGVMQGGGASLPNYKSQQLPVLRAYETNCIPAVFRPASKLQTTFRRWVSGFSDDIGLFLNELGVIRSGIDSDLPMAQRVRNAIQDNLQRYEEYFFTAGGALNIKKCFYYLVGFQWTGTTWRYMSNMEVGVEQVTVTPTVLSRDSTPQAVRWCEAHEAERTLGSYIAPDGSSSRQIEVLFGKLKEWQQCLCNIPTTNVQAKWLSLQTVFLKKVLYPLIGHNCSEEDLQDIQRPVDRETLHILGLNEHFPRAVLHAPLKYGGMGSVSIQGQHVIDKLLLMIHNVRENGQMRETLLTSLGLTQLECGMPLPFFSLPAEQWYHLVTPTWPNHIWRECQPKGIEIRFHKELFWVPKPVRECDVCIMQIASTMYSGEQLYRINMCRLALQVTYLSDIAAVDGKRILLAYYNGKAHKESGRRTRLNWPPIGELPVAWWTLWKEFLVRWCGTALRIPEPLGRWFSDAEMLTQCCFFLAGRQLIMQHGECFYAFNPFFSRARTRFQLQANHFIEVQLLSTAKVVDIVYKSNSIFVVSQSSQNIIDPAAEPVATCLQEMYSAMPSELQRIVGKVEWPQPHELIAIAKSISEGTAMGVSDGSVRTIEDKSTQAWVIQAIRGGEIRGLGPVDGTTDARTSHRAELQGQAAIVIMFSLIVQYFNIIGGKLATYCDNQSVVRKMRRGWNIWRYRNTKGPDGDLQALLRQRLRFLQKEHSTTISTDWVKGHQDDLTELSALPSPVALNVRMDHATKEAYQLPTKWHTTIHVPVLKDEGCAVYIGDAKLTSNIHLSLSEQWHDRDAREYLKQRHGITTDLLETIHWQSMRFALKKLSPHRRATALKAIHRHLPTQAKLFDQGRVVLSSLCPRCLQASETNSHVYCCPNEMALRQRKEDWRELWKQLRRIHTASVIEQTWRYYLHPIVGIPLGDSIIDGLTIAHGDLAGLLELAVREQQVIGWEKLLLGMGSKVWKTIQDLIDSANPKPPKRNATAWLNSATHQFLKFSLRCWKERNNMVHGSTRQEQRAIELEQARDRIKAIYANPPTLAPQFRSILEIPLVHRLNMPLQAAEHWLSLIDHQVRVTQHNTKILLRQHHTIQTHLRTMRLAARNQAKDRALPETPRKAHRRAVAAAVKEMREKLYSTRSTRTLAKSIWRTTRASKKTQTSCSSVVTTAVSSSLPNLRGIVGKPSQRRHPP